MTKKFSEITVTEFLKAAEEKDTNHVLQDERFGLLNVLKQEGYTTDDALRMNLKKAWEFYVNCLITNPSKVLHHFYFASEVSSEDAPIMRSYLEKISELYTEVEKDFYKKSSNESNCEK